MTIVHVGNFDAVEERFNEAAGRKDFFPVEPRAERVTSFHLAPQLTFMEQVNHVIAGLAKMMAQGCRPWWIEASDDQVGSMLRQHYGLTEGAMARPQNWGDGSTTAPKDQQGE